jgi:hypothetical protein
MHPNPFSPTRNTVVQFPVSVIGGETRSTAVAAARGSRAHTSEMVMAIVIVDGCMNAHEFELFLQPKKGGL